MRVLIYALGGGLGHVNRALSLSRALTRRSAELRCRVLSNSALVRPLVPAHPCPRVELCFLDPDWSALRVQTELRPVFRSGGFDLLVVDTFPRGLGGELVPLLEALRRRPVLIHRCLPRAYVERFDLSRFVAERYGQVLLPGEDAALGGLAIARRTAPWLIREAEELRPRDQVRLDLGVAQEDRLVAVIGCGRAEEIEEIRGLVRQLEQPGRALRLFTPTGPSPRWPLFEDFLGFDAIIGAGGYNTVHEARAARRPLLALAQRRLYDDQAARLNADERIDHPSELPTRLDAALRMPPSEETNFENGAAEAARLILDL